MAPSPRPGLRMRLSIEELETILWGCAPLVVVEVSLVLEDGVAVFQAFETPVLLIFQAAALLRMSETPDLVLLPLVKKIHAQGDAMSERASRSPIFDRGKPVPVAWSSRKWTIDSTCFAERR